MSSKDKDKSCDLKDAEICGIYGAFFEIRLLHPTNREKLLAKASGKLKNKVAIKSYSHNEQRHLLAVGDKVLVKMITSDEGANGIIEDVAIRKNSFMRGSKFRVQTIGCNLDMLIIVSSLCSPAFNGGFIERCLVEASQNDIETHIVLNKVDLLDSKTESSYDEIKNTLAYYSSIGITSSFESSINKVSDELLEKLKNKTSLLIGLSGAGKSTLINAIGKKDIQSVASVGSKGKGRHTTTNSKLFYFSNNIHVIDVPGVREFGLNHLTEEMVKNSFSEFKNSNCVYSNCKHLEEPNCEVKKRLQKGELLEFRYKSYVSILASINEKYKIRKGNLWAQSEK